MIQFNWLVESTLFLCRPIMVGDCWDSKSEVLYLCWSVAFEEDRILQKVKVILSARGKQIVVLVAHGATLTLT